MGMCNGKLLVSGHSDGKLKLWNVETGKEIYTWLGGNSEIKSVAFNHSNTKILAVSDKINIYNVDGSNYK